MSWKVSTILARAHTWNFLPPGRVLDLISRNGWSPFKGGLPKKFFSPKFMLVVIGASLDFNT